MIKHSSKINENNNLNTEEVSNLKEAFLATALYNLYTVKLSGSCIMKIGLPSHHCKLLRR
jgi:hypothetical protein